MSVTITSRQSRREKLAELIAGDVAAFEAVLAYPPITLDGKSPVCTVHSNGTLYSRQGNALVPAQEHFYVTLFVRRSAEGWTEEDAENKLDELSAAVAQAVVDHQNTPGFWLSLTWNDVSQPDFGEVGGVDYRVEVIALIAAGLPTG
jgi:hypothetical protein